MSRGRALAAALVAGAMLGGCAQPVIKSSRPSGLTARNGELLLSTEDGRELRSRDLLGATLTLGSLRVRLDAVEPTSLPSGRSFVFHHFVRVGDSGGPSEYCHVDPDGHRWALPLQGGEGHLSLACTAGAIGKCARWGYWPEDPATRELHEACVRMVRADYGGDGATATWDGTGIRFCDRAGIFPCEGDGDHRLEAAWSKDGAVCVARPRIPEIVSLEQLEIDYPRLKDHVGETACTLAAARSDPSAVLFGLVP